MKKKILRGAAAICLCVLLFSFQRNEVNLLTFACLNHEYGSIKARLESSAAVKQRPKGKTTAATYQIEGVKSPVRLGPKDSFFQVVSDRQINTRTPAGDISFYKLSSGRTGRTLVIDPATGDNALGFQITPLDGGTWQLVIVEILARGEYAFIDKTSVTPEGNFTVWTFGID